MDTRTLGEIDRWLATAGPAQTASGSEGDTDSRGNAPPPRHPCCGWRAWPMLIGSDSGQQQQTAANLLAAARSLASGCRCCDGAGGHLVELHGDRYETTAWRPCACAFVARWSQGVDEGMGGTWWRRLARGGKPGLLDLVEPTTPAHALAIEVGRAWASGVGLSWLVLLGPRGTGKTHVAVGALVERWAGGFPTLPAGRLVRLREVLSELRASWSGGDGPSEREVLAQTLAGPLVLDEIDQVRGSEMDMQQLDDLLWPRHRDSVPTVLVGNLEGSGPGGAISALSSLLGPRLSDRLVEVARVLWLGGPSGRRPRS